MLDGRGGLAQLVERLLCKQDVSGSSPLTSTDKFQQLMMSIERLHSLLDILSSQNLENCIKISQVSSNH